jgi:hypothetical protein
MPDIKKTKKSIITGSPDSPFEQIKKFDDEGVEYWPARDLGKILGYREYKNFVPAIERAITACNETGAPASDHFVEINEMVAIGSKAKREFGCRSEKSFALRRIANPS